MTGENKKNQRPQTGPGEVGSSRPHMPGYGLLQEAEGTALLPWSGIIDKMTAARNYWISTVTPDSKPHVTPVWGLWHEEHFFFASGPDSRKARNLKINPFIVVHLESGDDVVIIEGITGLVSDHSFMSGLDTAYFKKYAVRLEGYPIYQVTPSKVFAWSEADFPSSATRWEMGE